MPALSSQTATIVLVLYWPVIGWLFTVFEADWSVQDTMYFMVTTLTTVGYGDVAPSSWQGRLLAVVFMLFNVSCMSFIVHKAVSHNAARQEAHVLSELDGDAGVETSVEAAARLETENETEMEAIISGLSKNFRYIATEASESVAQAIADTKEQSRRASVSRHIGVTVAFFLLGTVGFRYMGFGGCEEPMCDLDGTTDDTALCLSGCHSTCLCTQDAAAEAAGATGVSVDELVRSASTDEVELVRLHVGFDECPAACASTSTCEGYATPIPRNGAKHGSTGVCSEYREWVDALYVATYTMTTVGYGDIPAPRQWRGRVFIMIFSVVSTLLLTSAVANAVNYLHSRQRRADMRTMFSNPLYLQSLLKRMDGDGDASVTELEFVRYMLVLQHKASLEDFEILHSQFEALDTNGNGVLAADDIKSVVDED